VVAAVPASFLIRRALNPSPGVDPIRSGPAPSFTLKSLDGTTVSSDGLAGRPAVVHFWGSWCEQCRLQLPLLRQAKKDHSDLGVVGIVFRDPPADAARLARTVGVDWPVLLDPDEKVARAYGVESAPVMFFLRPDGTIAGRLVGPIAPLVLDRALTRIL
jgi:cytochrome c biogenesis protein CcmG/thiol:disulfide interchange protein DsbE